MSQRSSGYGQDEVADEGVLSPTPLQGSGGRLSELLQQLTGSAAATAATLQYQQQRLMQQQQEQQQQLIHILSRRDVPPASPRTAAAAMAAQALAATAPPALGPQPPPHAACGPPYHRTAPLAPSPPPPPLQTPAWGDPTLFPGPSQPLSPPLPRQQQQQSRGSTRGESGLQCSGDSAAQEPSSSRAASGWRSAEGGGGRPPEPRPHPFTDLSGGDSASAAAFLRHKLRQQQQAQALQGGGGAPPPDTVAGGGRGHLAWLDPLSGPLAPQHWQPGQQQGPGLEVMAAGARAASGQAPGAPPAHSPPQPPPFTASLAFMATSPRPLALGPPPLAPLTCGLLGGRTPSLEVPSPAAQLWGQGLEACSSQGQGQATPSASSPSAALHPRKPSQQQQQQHLLQQPQQWQQLLGLQGGHSQAPKPLVAAHGSMQYPAAEASQEQVLGCQEVFTTHLRRLHDCLGSKFRVPVVGGQELNLWLLYKQVCAQGGLTQVVSQKRWAEVCEPFNFPPTFTSRSYTMRKLYSQILWHFEQVYLHGTRGPLLLPPAPEPPAPAYISTGPFQPLPLPKRSRTAYGVSGLDRVVTSNLKPAVSNEVLAAAAAAAAASLQPYSSGGEEGLGGWEGEGGGRPVPASTLGSSGDPAPSLGLMADPGCRGQAQQGGLHAAGPGRSTAGGAGAAPPPGQPPLVCWRQAGSWAAGGPGGSGSGAAGGGLAVGQAVRGEVTRVFECGAWVQVEVGGQQFQGVLYLPPTPPTPGHPHPLQPPTPQEGTCAPAGPDPLACPALMAAAAAVAAAGGGQQSGGAGAAQAAVGASG